MSSMEMKQNNSIALPRQIASATNAPIKDSERIQILNINSKGSTIMDTSRKRQFFLYLLNIRHNILTHAKNLDQSGRTKNIEKDLDAALPSSRRMIERDWKTDILGTKFVELYQPMETMTNCLKEQFLAQSQCRTVTRSNSAAVESNPVLEALEKMEEVMREVDLAVIETRTKSLYAAFKKAKLTPKQRSRR